MNLLSHGDYSDFIVTEGCELKVATDTYRHDASLALSHACMHPPHPKKTLHGTFRLSVACLSADPVAAMLGRSSLSQYLVEDVVPPCGTSLLKCPHHLLLLSYFSVDKLATLLPFLTPTCTTHFVVLHTSPLTPRRPP